MRFASFLAVATLSVAFILGCGSPGANLPKTVPATGVVTLDGKPVDGAQVVIVPAGEGKNGASAVTNASGHFALRAYPDVKDGAIPGDYKVQVSKTVAVPLPGKMDGGDAVRYDYAVPGKYTTADKSGLKVTIPEAGVKDIKLELTSK